MHQQIDRLSRRCRAAIFAALATAAMAAPAGAEVYACVFETTCRGAVCGPPAPDGMEGFVAFGPRDSWSEMPNIGKRAYTVEIDGALIRFEIGPLGLARMVTMAPGGGVVITDHVTVSGGGIGVTVTTGTCKTEAEP